MKALRHDAWTDDDDRVLAEIVLRHIQEGSPQLAAFEECAKRLGRTAAACGYRWNAHVRKSFQSGIEIAKALQKSLKAEQKRNGGKLPTEANDGPDERQMTWDDCLRFLRKYRREHSTLQRRVRKLERDLTAAGRDLKQASEENEQLRRQLQKLSDEHEAVKEDYKKLVRIMEKARRLTLFEPEAANSGMITRFRMDGNGNLERIN